MSYSLGHIGHIGVKLLFGFKCEHQNHDHFCINLQVASFDQSSLERAMIGQMRCEGGAGAVVGAGLDIGRE